MQTAIRRSWGRGNKFSGVVRAFTLLELMVSITIFGMVLAGLYSTWALVLRGNASALRLAAEAQRARMTARAVEDALVAAEMFPQNGRYYTFLADTSGSFAALSLCGHMSESFPGSGYFNGERLRRVTFLVQSAANGQNQMLLQQNSMFASGTEEDQGVYSLILARDVTLFQLEFFHKQVTRGEWATEWLSTNQLPQLVRVNLGLGHSARDPRVPDQLVSRIVALPAVGVVP